MRDRAMYRAILAVTLLLIASASAAQVTVVNMVPPSRSGEYNHDSEPTLTINPRNPMQFAASAFTWDNLTGGPMLGALAPIWISTDGGMQWDLVNIVPTVRGSSRPTNDITLHFSATESGSNSFLYVAYIDPGAFNTPQIRVYRTGNYAVAADMKEIYRIPYRADQPHINVITASAGVESDRVYVGINSSGQQDNATVSLSMDGAGSPSFDVATLRSMTNSGNAGGYANMTATCPDGTIYAAYYEVMGGGLPAKGNVFVDRDDHWAAQPPRFHALMDGNKQGSPVVTSVAIPAEYGAMMGKQVLGLSNLSIAVDPHHKERVYVAWGDQPDKTTEQTQSLHVRRSTDSGVHWSKDLVMIPHAVNPSLAINSEGRVALLYQLFYGPIARWETHLIRTTDAEGTVFDTPGLTLAQWNIGLTATDKDVLPYLGDYETMLAYGRDFYGVFSASNYPDHANFPHGVIFRRYADFERHKLYANQAKTTEVDESIDPYFFHIAE